MFFDPLWKIEKIMLFLIIEKNKNKETQTPRNNQQSW